MTNPIASAREAAGFRTRYAAAKAIGVLPHHYNAWEAGQRRPSAASYLRLANAFGCTVDALMGRTAAEPVEVA